MQSLGQFLRAWGLDTYTDAMIANDVDLEVLQDLSDTELERLGLSLGDRKRLRKALASLRGPGSEANQPQLGEAERRQLTVLFCDLVGSTMLSARVDPEDMRAVLRAFQDSVSGAIARFDGFVAKFMGDGVLAYFGYPQAHEDDAERAVRAGLEMLQAVARLESADGKPMSARVGIATGLVVVGDLVGAGEARERAVSGETPNVAARLQALAEPGTLLVAMTTRRLVGELFDLSPLGPVQLKGLGSPVQAWRVIGERAVDSRYEARSRNAPGNLVGRHGELGTLLDCWSRAKAGVGQLVVLSGQAGLGKSRLVRALCDAVAEEPHVRLRYQCSPHHIDSPLHPVLVQLARAAGFAPGDDGEVRLDKIEALATAHEVDPATVAPYLAELLSVPAAGRYGSMNLPPDKVRERILSATVDWILGPAARRPVLLFVEDAHWIDPTTLVLLDRLAARLPGSRVLAVVTARPEFQRAFVQASVTLLTLNRLAHREGAEIVLNVTRGKPLPQEVLSQILDKSDGVPLFIEELTKAVLESGLLREETTDYALTGELPALAVPATLHDSLMERLDRLSPLKQVAQIGAAIGRAFPYALLSEVAELKPAVLRDAIDRLLDAGIIDRLDAEADEVFFFKHALVQDAAYASLLRDRRRQLNARIAAALLELSPASAEAEPELLAHYCEEAGLTAQAVDYLERAGKRAIGKAATLEAIAHLRRGIALIQNLPSGIERDRKELNLQTALAAQLAFARGYSSPEAQAAFERGHQLCSAIGAAPDLFPVLFGLWRFYLAAARYSVSLEIGQQCLDLAQATGDSGQLQEAHHALAWTLFAQGRFAEAHRQIEQAISLHDPERDSGLRFVHGTDPGAHSTALSALILWKLGDQVKAHERANEALARARALDHPPTLSVALTYWGFLHAFAGRPEAVLPYAREGLALCRQHSIGMYLAINMVLEGWARGGAPDALDLINGGIAAFRKSGAEVLLSFFLYLLGSALAAAGKAAEAASVLADAAAVADRNQEGFCRAEIAELRQSLSGVVSDLHSSGSATATA